MDRHLGKPLLPAHLQDALLVLPQLQAVRAGGLKLLQLGAGIFFARPAEIDALSRRRSGDIFAVSAVVDARLRAGSRCTGIFSSGIP
jgi:hypothetical protein